MAAFRTTGYILKIYMLLLLTVLSSVSAFIGASTNNFHHRSATLLHALNSDEIQSGVLELLLLEREYISGNVWCSI